MVKYIDIQFFIFHFSFFTYLIYPPVFFDIQALLNVFEANFN